MADKNTQTEAQKLEEKSREDRENQLRAEEDARRAGLSDEERKAEDARLAADKSESEAVDARARELSEGSEEATPAVAVKSVAAAVDPKLDIGAHHVQTFANTPENPQLAPGLDPEEGANVRLELNDSDHPDPMNPKVTYVHERMVGDYIRAGWRRPVA